ncbi:MAG: RAMP superfamily CRISPR-associated protein [Acetobacteraceae bacterium]
MSAARTEPPPPGVLPQKRKRTRRGEAERAEFSVELETTTPLLGGSPELRKLDTVDVIRVPTIRGHLRFWWRALQTHHLTERKQFAQAEEALWGKAADQTGGRSQVEITVEIRSRDRLRPDHTNITAQTAGNYALWPARKAGEEPPAPRLMPGVRFRLTVSAPGSELSALRNTVRAWILFGGYGSRTRRGVGSLTVTGSHQTRAEWLPGVDEPEELRDELAESLQSLFGRDVFEPSDTPLQLPLLSGAKLLVGGLERDALKAWGTALDWLHHFRQGPDFAREPGNGPSGKSRWPEADKLRHLSGRHGHSPRYDKEPAWPRAEFGLPIVGRFVGAQEPPPFEIIWVDNERCEPQDRMASPLILKALPTLQGFRPCALWLARPALPGRVAIRMNTQILPNSYATPGYIGSKTDQAKYITLKAPLARNLSVQNAFLNWIVSKKRVVWVAP